MRFVDSSFLIALLRANDENHEEASRFSRTLEKARLATSDLVLAEVVTFIQRKDGRGNGALAARRVLNSGIELMYGMHDDFLEAVKLMEKFDCLSFADAVSVTLMRRNDISEIVSFDSDFDLIKGISRCSQSLLK